MFEWNSSVSKPGVKLGSFFHLVEFTLFIPSGLVGKGSLLEILSWKEDAKLGNVTAATGFAREGRCGQQKRISACDTRMTREGNFCPMPSPQMISLFEIHPESEPET